MNEKNQLHSKLLTQAASMSLGPIGLFQKGRSRIWLSDQHWWVGIVEFQPSSWAKGSYLNVGCMWLWNTTAHISFDEGYRIESLHRFESGDQFRPLAEKLAQRGALEILHYRDLFPSIRAVSDYYLNKPPDTFWPKYNAAISHGLSDRADQGATLLSIAISQLDTSVTWQAEAKSDASSLLSQIHSVPLFRQHIVQRILQARNLQKLPPIDETKLSLI
jgi:hypothetical protein